MQQNSSIPEQVRDRAYQLWEAEGRPHGRDQAHWFQAERELGTAAYGTAPATAAKSTRRRSNGNGTRMGRKRKADEVRA